MPVSPAHTQEVTQRTAAPQRHERVHHLIESSRRPPRVSTLFLHWKSCCTIRFGGSRLVPTKISKPAAPITKQATKRVRG